MFLSCNFSFFLFFRYNIFSNLSYFIPSKKFSGLLFICVALLSCVVKYVDSFFFSSSYFGARFYFHSIFLVAKESDRNKKKEKGDVTSESIST